MSTIKKVLVPYDGSKHSVKAAEFAADLVRDITKDSSVQIILLNVVPEIPTSPLFIERPMSTTDRGHMPLSRYLKELYAEMKEQVHEMLEEEKSKLEVLLDAKATIKTAVLVGDPVAEKILAFARNEKIDMIIIGSIGLSGLAKLKTLGSVSRAVSERAQCPVTIVH